MSSRAGGAQHLRTVALVLVAGCLVSFAAGQVAGHYALPAPPLASLAARADAPVATAIAGALSKVQRPTARQPATHKPTSKPATKSKTRSQPKAKKASHPHAKHKPKPKHRDHHGKKGHSGGKGEAGKLSPGELTLDQPTAQAISTDGPESVGNIPVAQGPERLPPESAAGG